MTHHVDASSRLAVLSRQLTASPTCDIQRNDTSEEDTRPAPGGGRGTLTVLDNRSGKKYTVRFANLMAGSHFMYHEAPHVPSACSSKSPRAALSTPKHSSRSRPVETVSACAHMTPGMASPPAQSRLYMPVVHAHRLDVADLQHCTQLLLVLTDIFIRMDLVDNSFHILICCPLPFQQWQVHQHFRCHLEDLIHRW